MVGTTANSCINFGTRLLQKAISFVSIVKFAGVFLFIASLTEGSNFV